VSTRLRLFGMFWSMLVISMAASVRGQVILPADFDWRSAGGLNFVTPVKDQGGGNTCWTFAPTAALEAKYKLTRNDPLFNLDASEQNLVCAGGMGDAVSGGWEYLALDYFTSTGIVRESELPYTAQNTSPNWPLQPSWESRVLKSTSNHDFLPASNTSLKTDLLMHGPLVTFMSADNDWYPSGAIRGGHAVAIFGYHDAISGDDAAVQAAGGYWIVKNSWGAGWGASGYGKILYGVVEGHNRVHAINGAVYYTGPMATAIWQGSAGTWSAGNSGNWTSNGIPYAWENQETAAIFTASAAANPITISGTAIAHGLTFTSGSVGYVISDGALTVTAGGITANESVVVNSPLTIGAPQTWNVAAGKVLTINGNVHTVISDLTLTGPGETIVVGAIDDGGVINSYGATGGGLILQGPGTLTLGGPNSFTGTTQINGGTLVLDFTHSGAPDSNILFHGITPTETYFGGGTLLLHGKAATANSQTFGNLTFNTGASAIELVTGIGGSMVFTASNTWTRNSGSTVDFRPNGQQFNSNPATSNGLVVGTGSAAFATVNGSDWATVTGGSIAAYTGYLADQYGASTNTEVTAANTNLNNGFNTYSLAFRLNQSYVMTLGNTGTLQSGGILVASSVGNNTTITGGSLTSRSGEVLVHQFSSGTLTIGSQIANRRSTSVGLTKAGGGTLLLTASNTYTGPTTIGAGTLLLSGSLNNTAISVHGGATLAATGAASAGTTDSGASGATLTFDPGANFSMVDGVIGTFNLRQQNNYSGQALTIGGSYNAPMLSFEINSAGADSLVLTNTQATASVGPAGATIDVVALSPLTSGATFTLISIPGGGLGGAKLTYPSGATSEIRTISGSPYWLTLHNTNTAESISAALVTSAAYNLTASSTHNRIIVGGSTTLTGSVVNSGTETADILNVAGLSMATSAPASISLTPSSAAGLLPGAGFSGMGTFTGETAGAFALTAIVSSAVNANLGNAATFGAGAGASITVLDHSNASFAGDAKQATLTASLGSHARASGQYGLGFSVHNLQPASGYTAGLDLESVASAPTPSPLSTDLNLGNFPTLAAGSSRGYNVSLDTSSARLGTYNATFTLNVKDENLPGGIAGAPLVIQASGTVTGEAVWTASGNGFWSADSNWDIGVPQNINDTARFGGSVAEPAIVALDTSPILGNLIFSSTASRSYTIAQSGGNHLTLDNGGNNASIVVSGSGSHAIAAPVVLNSDVIVSPAMGTTLSISGQLSGSKSLTKTDSGELILAGTLAFSGSTTVSAGILTYNTSAAAAAVSSLAIAHGATVNAGGTVDGDPFTAGSSHASVFNDGTLNILSGSKSLANITGTGLTSVAGGAILRANHIHQDTLVLGGTSEFNQAAVVLNDFQAGSGSMAGAAASGAAVPMNQVPEPGTLVLFLVAGMPFAAWSRRKIVRIACPK
jgi:fibronectin-binding autotransporter adhesin